MPTTRPVEAYPDAMSHRNHGPSIFRGSSLATREPHPRKAGAVFRNAPITLSHMRLSHPISLSRRWSGRSARGAGTVRRTFSAQRKV
jgi:hypothetical protein